MATDPDDMRDEAMEMLAEMCCGDCSDCPMADEEGECTK